MPDQDSIDVTLAHVDPSLLSCWQEMVKRGVECSLLLKHRSGKMIATLQCTTSSTRSSSPSTSSSSAKKRKKNRGNKMKRLEALLAYHQRLVTEKGLPPSRLMKQHAAALAPASSIQSSGGKQFKCDQCKFESDSQRGLRVHIGRSHKEQQLSEVLRDGDLDVTLPLVSDVGDDMDRSSVYAGSSNSSSPTAEQSETKVLQDCPEPNATSSPLVKAPVLKRSPSAPVILKKPVRMLNGDPVWVKGK